MTSFRILLATALLTALSASASPAFAKDPIAPSERDAGPGMGGPAEIDPALGVTVPIGKQHHKPAEGQAGDQTRPNCGETVTMAADGSQTVVPTPCR